MAQSEEFIFPGWEVTRKLGEGSFGGVYEIRRTLPGGRVEKCALKRLTVPRDSEEIRELYAQSFSKDSITAHYKGRMEELVNEYGIMQSLSGCPNIVNCHDIQYVQHDDGIGWDIYIRMELLYPLKKVLGSSYSEDMVCNLGIQLCNALTACHGENIIHRDIKPENILVSGKGTFKLGDFGIAKVSEKTGTGTMTGTYGYMAPEVANRQHYGASVDIYSLGMVLYWMMNRHTLPFLPLPPSIPTGAQRQQAQDRRLSGEPLPPPADGSEALKKIVLKACAFSPAERYRSAEEMQAALQSCLSTPAAPRMQRQEPMAPPAPISEPTIIDTPTELEYEPAVHANAPQQRQQIPVQQGRQRMAEKQTPEKEAPKKDAPKKKQKKPVIYRVMVSLIAAALILACCGIGIMVYHYAGHFSNEPQTESGTVPAPHEEDDRVITVAASPTPHAEILKAAAKVLEKDGWTLDVKEYSDYVVPNNVVEDGEVDANYFQHQPYLDTFNAENGTHLVSVAQVHYEPFGIYAGTKSSIDELEDGDKIAIPNDGSNRARALLLLEANGIITLTEGVGMQATKVDIVDKSVDVEIVEMEAAQIPKVREDSVALAVINGNYALQAGLNVAKDAIASEDPDSVSAQTYANVLVVKEGNENSEKTQALKKALLSDDVRAYINETYSGSVVPLGGSADSAPVSASLRVLRNDETYSEDDAILGQEVLRKEVATITFLSTLDDAPADAWDLSEADDGSVLGWITGTKGNYDLYIAADGCVVAPRRSDYLFAYYTNLREINFNGCFDTSAAATMGSMFESCGNLQSLDLNSFDTSQVADMSWMFGRCSALTSISISSFNTSNVLNMYAMFDGCSALTSIDISNFDTSNVIDMSVMFADCESLTSIDVSNFNTSNVIRMRTMFYGCSALTSIDVSSFNTSHVIDMGLMFSDCKNLQSLDLSGFDTSRVTDMGWMFAFCPNLKSIDLSSFDTSLVTDMDLMFANCDNLVDLDLESFDFTNVTHFREFMSTGKLYNGQPWNELFEEVPRRWVLREDSAWEEGAAVFGTDILRSEVTAITFLDSLDEAPTDAWDLSGKGYKKVLGWVTGTLGDYHLFIAEDGGVVAPQNCSYLFFGYTNLREIEFNNCFDTSDVYWMDSMFDGCTSLTSLDLSGFDTEKVTTMSRMFYNCHNLTKLNLSSFRAQNVDSLRAMFVGCSSLTELNLSGFNTPHVTSMRYMFSGCESLTSLNLSGLDTSYVMTMEGMFESCSSLEDVDLSNFDFARVIYYDNFMDEGRTYNGKPWEALFTVTASTQKQ